MRHTLSFVVTAVLTALLLSGCDFVDQKETENYAITLPAKLPIYNNGHYIQFRYKQFFVNGQSVNKNGYLRFAWTAPSATITLPFNQGNLSTHVLPRTLLRFVATEFLGEGGPKYAVQYTTQDNNGSFFVHGFEGVGVTESTAANDAYWPSEDLTFDSATTLTPFQLLWSPINDGAGTTYVGMDFVAQNLVPSQNLFDNCISGTCTKRGSIEWIEYRFETTTESVKSAIGTFEAYRLRYKGRLIVDAEFFPSPLLDIRLSCWSPGEEGTIEIAGSILIYPPIGPVAIDNGCLPPTFTNRTYFDAVIEDTNINF